MHHGITTAGVQSSILVQGGAGGAGKGGGSVNNVDLLGTVIDVNGGAGGNGIGKGGGGGSLDGIGVLNLPNLFTQPV